MVFNYFSPDPSEDDDDSPRPSLPASPSFAISVPPRGIFPRALSVASRVTEDASLEFPATSVDVSGWRQEDSSDALDLQSVRPQPPAQMTVVLKVQMHCDGCARVMKKLIWRIEGVEMVKTDVANDQLTVIGVIDQLKLVEYVYKRMGKRAVILKDEEKNPSSFSNAMEFPSEGTHNIAGADARSQMETVNNVIAQALSLQTHIPSLLPASEQGQATSSRSSPANQNDNVDKPANIDAQKSLAVHTPHVNLVPPSPGHSPLPSSMLQPISQTDGEETLGSFVKARLTLERSLKVLYSEAVSFDIATPESSSILVNTDDAVNHKWAEFLELSKGGYPLIAANPATTERVKALLKELCGGDISLSKSPKFRKRCEDFLTKFLSGIDAYRQNCERIAALADSEKDYGHSDNFIKGLDQTLKDSRHALQVLVDEQNDLAAEETKLERQLAELERRLIDVRCQRRLKATEIIQADRTLQSHLEISDQKYRLNKELAEHRHAKNQLVFDNSCLELDLSIFQKEVRDFVDSM